MKLHLPPDASPEEVDACVRAHIRPRSAAMTIGGKGLPPSFRQHGQAMVPAIVELIHGRWEIRCPCCTLLQPLTAVDRFKCALCKNAAAGGRWCDTLWPDPETAKRIFSALDPRPAEARNWVPGETIADLRADNIDHGLIHVG